MSRSDRTLTRGPLRAGAQVDRARVAALGEQRVDLALELLEVLEALVDAGESDVGDLVDAAQLLHGHRADARRRDLGDAARRAAPPRSRRPRLGGAVGDGPPRQRLAQARSELVAVELLARPSRLTTTSRADSTRS